MVEYRSVILFYLIFFILVLIQFASNYFRFYRAMLAQSAVMRLHVVRPSVCLSVRNDQVPCSNTLEFFENNFTAE